MEEKSLLSLTNEDRQMIERAASFAISADAFFAVEPHGHTEYQLRTFLGKDYPTEDSKYRQYCRELWSRIEAMAMDRFGIAEAEAQTAIESAKRDLLRVPWWNMVARWRAGAAERAAEADWHAIQADKHAFRRTNLSIDLKYRVVREMKVILDMITRIDGAKVERDRMKAEAERWAKRAETIPELRAVLEANAPPAATNGAGA